MKVPISWLKDFVEINIPIEELAHRLTMGGLEVEAIQYVGLPLPKEQKGKRPDYKVTGLEWDPEKIVTAAILEVMPHPNADRLVLCRLIDGGPEQVILTGAPNLYDYKGKGPMEKPIKVAYAREGSRLYDGHQPGQVLTTLKRTKIRGVESYSMVCSEKELGISDEHEGIIILDEDAPVGVPLAEYMGDAVLEISILPNTARDANIYGVAREVAAITGQPLKKLEAHPKTRPDFKIEGKVSIEIENPELNPRFVAGLITGIDIHPSPYWVQRRLRLAGMRPISNIVDVTNYAMLEVGEPLHAFDYDVLVKRAGGEAPKIITRTAHPGEKLTTLDGVERDLTETTVLVCDTAGALSIAGVMGGAESEVSDKTTSILLEGAAWNFINIRRTANAQHLMSEAAYRFSRGVHPAMAPRGVLRGLELMQDWAGGRVAEGLMDDYPLPPHQPTVTTNPSEIERWLGIWLSPAEIADILRRLEFDVTVDGENVTATAPDHRMDISEGIVGRADLAEEVARVYGYDRIPETRMADELPPQVTNHRLDREERIRNILTGSGAQEVINYRMTSPEDEARRIPEPDPKASAERADALTGRPYVEIANPLTPERSVLRQSLLASVLDTVERNARIRDRMVLFEIGPVFLSEPGGGLPTEAQRLAIALTGPRQLPDWQGADTTPMDFFDLKGVVQTLLSELHVPGICYAPGKDVSFHPGKCALVMSGEKLLGSFGELHPLVREHYEVPSTPILAGEFDLDILMELIPSRYEVSPVPSYPPVLEDLAVIVDEAQPADRVEELIRQTGGKTVTDVRLFDVYRGEQIGPGKKSLAYSLTYQDPERTLTDEEVSKIRQKIVRRLEQEMGAKLRS